MENFGYHFGISKTLTPISTKNHGQPIFRNLIMEPQKVTAIFDIGKTNKKFFLFDGDFNEVYKVYHRMETTTDDDGDPCESLTGLTDWVKNTLEASLFLPQFQITKLNFTSYGATLVHLDGEGQPVTALYNYLKGFPKDLMDTFNDTYGDQEQLSRETSSPALGMLNSGLQLYWLKHTKPVLFSKIKYSLHLPNYLSFLFTGRMVSEYTSIGCHTALWDFQKNSYHVWVISEGLDKILPAAVNTNETILKTINKQEISIGVGVHDSSSALLPYIQNEKEPFLLLSTGTWAISINPFNSTELTAQELSQDCLHFLGIQGNPIKISRLFIGEEHKIQIEKLYAHFSLKTGYYKKLNFDPTQYQIAIKRKSKLFRFEYLRPELFGIDQADKTELSIFGNFEEAYYCFLHELTELQVASMNLVLNNAPVKRIFIDGGFNANEIFVGMLREKLKPIPIETTDFALGTALGAAILVNSA